MSFAIFFRKQQVMNTDPQRRCYNGCNFSDKIVWTGWEVLDRSSTRDLAECRVAFWKELNDYAVSQRGKSARKEFKIVEEVAT
jgi:hypothetical protein